MRLRHKTNQELFRLYDSELTLRVRNARNLDTERKLLAKFREYLNDYHRALHQPRAFWSNMPTENPGSLPECCHDKGFHEVAESRAS